MTLLRSVAMKRRRKKKDGEKRIEIPQSRHVLCCYCFPLMARPETCGQKERNGKRKPIEDPRRKSSRVNEMYT